MHKLAPSPRTHHTSSSGTQVPEPRRSTAARRRTSALMLSSVVAGSAVLAMASPASAVGVVGPVSNINGAGTAFPASYQDPDGVKLVPCLTPAHCGGAAAEDVTAPDGEFFYNLVEGNVGGFRVVMGLEGAFVEDGTPVTFNRLRFRNSNATPGATYKIVHPYGTTTVTADSRGRARSDKVRADEGCDPAPGDSCNFAAAMGAGSAYTKFLTAANDKDASDGFLDNDGALSTITGSPTGNNFVAVYKDGKFVEQLNRFTVQAQTR